MVLAASFLRTVISSDNERDPAACHDAGGRSITYGDLARAARQHARALAQIGLQEGDGIAFIGKGGLSLWPLLLACSDAGLHITFISERDIASIGSGSGHAGRSHAGASRSGSAVPQPKLLVADATERPTQARPCLTLVELALCAEVQSDASLESAALDASIRVGLDGAAMPFSRLLQSAQSFCAAYEIGRRDVLLSASSPNDLDGLCASFAVPLVAGMRVIAVDDAADAERLRRGLAEASVVEVPAVMVPRLVEMTLPTTVRVLVCGSGRLSPAEIGQAEAVLQRPLHRGYGNAEIGLWAAATPRDGGALRLAAGSPSIAIRPLRSPIQLLETVPATPAGEIVWRWDNGTAEVVERRTGDIGWLTADDGLVIEGRRADVAVRNGRAILLPEIDAALLQHEGVRTSTSFLERGASPAEPVITVCATEIDGEALRAWLAERVAPVFVPSRIMTVSETPSTPERAARVAILRDVASGESASAALAAVTARRFRRNAAYDEAGFRELVQACLIKQAPLDFLMFWGCGPRPIAGAPDYAAITALHDLLDSVQQAAPIRARAHIVFTDLHARNNGHAETHWRGYFTSIEQAAGNRDVSYELESAVWRRGGLSQADVVALEQTPAFEEAWQAFPLRDRFVQQASRHSRRDDKVAAAQHYYATCLRERVVLRRLFSQSVFLTYNGPEFNECFPDLPTLYVYPGPRGPNDKPWFVHEDTLQAPRAAAE